MVAHTKVFVGSLPQGSKPEQLRKLFEGFGVVTECTVMNRCGFVHMQTEEQAAAAIRDLNKSTFNGGTIIVEKGKIKETKDVGPRGGGRGGPRGAMRGSVRHRDMRGGPLRGRGRRGGSMGGHPMSKGMPMRNGGGYNRGMDRVPMRGPYKPRFHPYGVPDSRGFTLMDPSDIYSVQPTMHSDNRHPFGAEGLHNRRAPIFHNNRVTRPHGSDLSTNRADPTMRMPAAAPGDYPYVQYPPVGARTPAAAPGDYPYVQYPPVGDGGGGSARH